MDITDKILGMYMTNWPNSTLNSQQLCHNDVMPTNKSLKSKNLYIHIKLKRHDKKLKYSSEKEAALSEACSTIIHAH